MQNARRTFSSIALAAALLASSACAYAQEMDIPVPPPLVARPAPIVAPETVAIGIVPAATRVRLGAPGGVIAWNADGIPHILPGGDIIAAADTQGVRWWFDTGTPGPASSTWEVRPMADETLVVQGTRYRGQIRLDALLAPATATGRSAAASNILVADTVPRLRVVNVLALEDYLRGVVPREIGTTRIELFAAIQAQAVAARTYTVRNLGRRRALGFDLFATHDDQVYGGASAEHPVVDSAIRSTAGEVLVFGDQLVEAFYHSTCGGATTARSDAWSGDQPYLRGVSDLVGETSACISSRYFRWSERYEGETLARLAAPAETIAWTLEGRDSSGRVRRLTLQRGDSTVSARGDAIRWLLRRPTGEPLRSGVFDIAGDSSTLVVTGRGWGHGIGMCQVGAIGRARMGIAYDAILAHYYPGTRLIDLMPAEHSGGIAEPGLEP